MCTANVKITPIYRSNNMFEMPSDLRACNFKNILGGHAPKTHSNSMLILAVLRTAF